jgi:hypothetical protein
MPIATPGRGEIPIGELERSTAAYRASRRFNPRWTVVARVRPDEWVVDLAFLRDFGLIMSHFGGILMVF